jgi:hypothetical protein
MSYQVHISLYTEQHLTDHYAIFCMLPLLQMSPLTEKWKCFINSKFTGCRTVLIGKASRSRACVYMFKLRYSAALIYCPWKCATWNSIRFSVSIYRHRWWTATVCGEKILPFLADRLCMRACVRVRVCLAIPVAARPKAWAFVHSLAGITSSNPAAGMDVWFLWVLCVVR